MIEKARLIKSVQESLVKDVTLCHQASAIAYEIFLLEYHLGLKGDSVVENTKASFFAKISDWEMTDLLTTQVGYAITIAESNGRLEYEEMHKLMALCDEILALEFIGFEFDRDLKRKYEEVVSERFFLEKKKAKLVSEDRAENWQKEFWWYRDNLE